MKGDLFIGDTNLGVGNVVKGGSFIVVAPYFRFSGRILSKGGPFYYLLSIFSLGRGEKILLAKHDGGYSSFLSFFFFIQDIYICFQFNRFKSVSFIYIPITNNYIFIK